MRLTAAQIKRFWAGVNKNGPVAYAKLGPCWIWTKGHFKQGYGQYRNTQTHRVAWRLKHGFIPSSKLVCHKCDVKDCVRLSHLFLGTHYDNTHDAMRKGRLALGDRHPARVNPSIIKRGAAHPNAKLTKIEVQEIRDLVAAGAMQKRLARKYEVSTSTICNLVHRRIYFA